MGLAKVRVDSSAAWTALLLGLVLLLDCSPVASAGCEWRTLYGVDYCTTYVWDGSFCGTEKSGCWKYMTNGYYDSNGDLRSTYGSYCCASSKDDCCNDKEALATGIIVVIVITVLVVVGSVIGCCFCCSGCPGYKCTHPPQQPTAPGTIMCIVRLNFLWHSGGTGNGCLRNRYKDKHVKHMRAQEMVHP
ncbi:hypothetical protein CYMTET_43800 [Cymbomonas tetramitiformis]|uniref:Uncharacterized protein n=1 Tax=Cymbomonas tetramitiformis TaxID=36881 RepID=A0AAE0F1A7_9CHLO|nr:hypothetical protein CYMTET_43800 [Cymbomonas tetramitiformis]